MIIKCPSCATRFNLPDDKFQEGRKVRCSKCKHVFPLISESQPAPPTAESLDVTPQPSATRPAVDHRFDDDLFGTPEGTGMVSPDFSPDAAVMKASSPDISGMQDEFAPDLRLGQPGAPEEDANAGRFSQMLSQELPQEDPYNIDAASKPSRQTAKLTIPKGQPKKSSPLKLAVSLFLFIVLAVAAAGILVWFFAPEMLPAPVRELVGGKEQGVMPEGAGGNATPFGPEVNQDMVKNLELKDAEQHFVKNDKVGELLVIQGQVVNNSPEPRELIKVEANLYDENGVRLDTKQQLIGNAISLFQLQQLTREELEKALNNPVGITTQNTNIKPGSTAPFMVIFYNPPASVKEYQVVIVDAKAAPKP